MSRSEFFRSLLAAAPKGHSSLPLCFKYVSEAHISQAKELSLGANYALEKEKTKPKLLLTPKQVEETVFLNICARKHSTVWEIAQTIKLAPNSSTYRTPTLYVLLLQLIALDHDPRKAMLALTLYDELFSCELGGTSLTTEERHLATTHMLSVFENCSDFSVLLPLKAVYESIVLLAVGSDFEAAYIGASLNVLINSHQYNKALELFERYLLTVRPEDSALTMQKLPVQKLFSYMALVHDLDSLLKWLRVARPEGVLVFSPKDWSDFLGMGLSLNHYKLVLFIYEHWIMAGLETELSVESWILSDRESALQNLNAPLKSLTDATLHQILHTFASHGDVNLTLNLIEWHYIHKSFKGGKALTKELCVDIIQSYCYYSANHSEVTHEDRSVEPVLEVVESFVSRDDTDFTLSYKDISDSFSYMFHHLRIRDANIMEAMQKHEAITQRFEEAHKDSEGEMPRKVTSTVGASSPYGNPLLNWHTLSQFTAQYINYLVTNSYSIHTIRLFICCLLNHTNKYQNFSGAVHVLNSIHKIHPSFSSDWMTDEMMSILIHSLSRSPSGKRSGYVLYQFSSSKTKISEADMVCFVLSSLHEPDYCELFQFYVFKYLCMQPTTISGRIIQRISGDKQFDGPAGIVVRYLRSHQHLPQAKEHLDQFWESNGLCKRDPSIPDEDPDLYSKFDMRDRERLQKVLCSS